MALEIFQNFVVRDFILPFLLIWTIVFAILEKSKLLGDGTKQLDAIVALVVGFIFVGAVFPKEVASNLILFLTVAIVVVFVGLLLWGFVSGSEAKIEGKGLKWAAGVLVVIAVVIALVWATGVDAGVFNFLFKQSWSNSFWTNFFFVAVVAIALALVLRNPSSGGK